MLFPPSVPKEVLHELLPPLFSMIEYEIVRVPELFLIELSFPHIIELVIT